MPSAPSFVCFGETLWDVLPAGRQPGGAPCNVAVHLHQFGQAVALVSRVGTDDLGNELLAFLDARGLGTDFVQRGQTHLTGVVKAILRDDHEVVYKIVQPVAWDYLDYREPLGQLVAGADVLVFGSLAARSLTTRETLYRLLPQARFRVFDVNLRAPHYTRPVVQYLLERSDLVKLNEPELAEILGWFGRSADDETGLAWLAARFNLHTVCVTRGAAGALLWTGGQCYRCAGVAVRVADTIGSGDAFLAALLAGWHNGQPPAHCLALACAAGALVATRQGATPAITLAQVAELKPAASAVDTSIQ